MLRGDKRGIEFDPPHLLVYFVIVAVIIALMALAISNSGVSNKPVEVKEVDIFKKQLEQDLKPSLISGQVVKEYDLPEGYTEFCVVDVNNADAGDVVDQLDVRDSLYKGSSRNVFLTGKNKKISFNIQGIGVSNFPYYACAEANKGKVELTAENQKGEVIVKLPPNINYCKNAQDQTLEDGRNLCDYLNDVYYPGYKEGCCKDYGYCC